ncbi:XRE family transcriptional regulator [Roseivivax halodurans JCM 10272]|uniref:XRE family transcriptional regulator n=1 Tax=Roseivivax halodurans JCM 10272 TaxID=1449350 RepID=X7ECG4_9RHOB|nr:helix-turn-helix domain-containing protein [Roseivivax halodurans]ETX13632.1 XRE family transcriptional regulator [Roseivivax halodurans JCM 10272]
MEPRRITNTFPDALRPIMHELGSDIAAARKVRKLTQQDMADRLNVGRTTVVRLEKGDPRVSFGTYAMAAWVMGLEQGLLSVFAQERDAGFQKAARHGLPKRVRHPSPESELGDLDF